MSYDVTLADGDVDGEQERCAGQVTDDDRHLLLRERAQLGPLATPPLFAKIASISVLECALGPSPVAGDVNESLCICHIRRAHVRSRIRRTGGRGVTVVRGLGAVLALADADGAGRRFSGEGRWARVRSLGPADTQQSAGRRTAACPAPVGAGWMLINRG